MRIRLTCPDCAKSQGGIGVWFTEIIREDGLYTGKCPRGHDLFLATQTLPHEMLFEIALNAINDGYYREAVSSFASSIERFFEFAVRVFASSADVPVEQFAKAWKSISNQSERQLGAYIFLYVTELKYMPPLLSDKMTKLRNEVIHKGKLPDRQEALSFGEAAYVLMQDTIRQLRTERLDDVNKILTEHVSGIFEKMGTRYPRAIQVTSTALNVIEVVSSDYRSFSQILLERGIANLA